MATPKQLKYRVSLDFPPVVKDTLEEIRDITAAASVTEVIKRALGVYRVLAKIQADGEQIQVVAKDGAVRQLVVL